MTSRR